MPAKATLVKVVHRKPEPFMPYANHPDYLLCFVTETLACGHALTVFPQNDPLIARHRRCQHCGQVPKKPVQAVGWRESEHAA